MGKKLKEIKAQMLALDLINRSRCWLFVLPKYLGGPLLAPADWTKLIDEALRNFPTGAAIILTLNVRARELWLPVEVINHPLSLVEVKSSKY